MALLGAICVFALLGGTFAAEHLDKYLDSALCENRLSAFLVADNTGVNSEPSRTFANVTEEQCREICTDNRDADGRLVLCASFSYDHIDFTCSIYKKKSSPDGTLERVAVTGKRYFEKFCLDESASKECANRAFGRVDDSLLTGYAKATSFHATLEGCVNKCLNETFKCKSAMYFYEEGECITNVESAISKPEDFGPPEDGDRVIYIANGCLPKIVEEKKKGASKKKLVQKKKSKLEKLGKKKVVIQEVTTTEAPAESAETEESTTPEVTAEQEQVEEATTAVIAEDEQFKTFEAVNHPKDIASKLYGAKQLSKSENGTIEVDDSLVENTTSAAEESGEEATEATEAAETTEAVEATTEAAAEDNEDEEESETETADEADDSTSDDEPLVAESESEETTTSAGNAPIESTDIVIRVDEDTNGPVVQQKPEEPEEKSSLKAKPVKEGVTKQLAIQKLVVPAEVREEDNYFSEWAEWTPCTQPGERKIRRRKCLDLKKCKGALMQVDWCPRNLPVTSTEAPDSAETGPVGPVREPLPVAKTDEGSPPGILPEQLPRKKLKPLPAGAPGSADDIWSPWLGVCQQFASTQPCKNNEQIGFESRECIAKDPKKCNGPFFRYCTIVC
uniref:Apple domain-containing protein n=1 Tax=Panagrellus redivivus TaxID=6233 RepID=A0A7E4ZUZ3_PANRE